MRPGTNGRLDPIAFALLLTFVALAPLLYANSTSPNRPAWGGGAVMPGGNAFLQVISFTLAALTLLARRRIAFRAAALPAAAAAGLVLLGVIQLIPFPESVLGGVAPVNVRIYHELAQVLRPLGSTFVPAPRISIAPGETVDVVLLLLSYVALFGASAALVNNRNRRRLLAFVLVGTAIAHITAAVISRQPGERVHGLFGNPNHFAGYLEIALAVAFGLLWTEVLTNRERAEEAEEHAERIERRLLPLPGYVLAWAVIALGIALTQSKGGILSAGLTTVTILLIATIHRRARRRKRLWIPAAAVLFAGLTLAIATAGTAPFRRLLETSPRDLGRDLRVQLWTSSLEAWKEFPVLGSGLGTFREALRRVQPRHLQGRIEQAHSDPLQLLVTGGAIGAALGILLVLSLLAGLLRAWRKQKHREASVFALAGFGALLSLTLHGLVEFNFSIPAIPATLACVLGTAWAAGRDR